MAIERRAPAKINLGLHVLRRREDGYHDIETVLVPIRWSDRLSVTAAPAIRLTCTDPSLPTDERNLVVQAAQRLAQHAGYDGGAHLHLDKHLPHGAGLGGGSSDAAAALLLLRAFWNLDVADTHLHTLAAGLGSDVPFFLSEGAAYATGRGEELEPIDVQCPPWIVVVAPPVRVSTPEAYQLVTPRADGRPDLRALVTSGDLTSWRTHLHNDFEEVIAGRHPAIATVKQALLEGGAEYAALSGSGSAVFGLFEQEAAARRAGRHFRKRKTTVWVGAVGPL